MKPQSHLWKFEELPPVKVGQRPKILLLGNGINRAFDGESWEKLIETAMNDNGCTVLYKDIKDMPATMQIVIASSKVYSKNENCQDISKFVQKLCKEWADNAKKNPKDKDCQSFDFPAFNGLAQFFVQTDHTGGNISLLCESEGLVSGSIEVISK